MKRALTETVSVRRAPHEPRIQRPAAPFRRTDAILLFMVGLQIRAALVIGLALGEAAPAAAQAARSPEDEARVLQAFADRLAEYAKMRKAAAEPIPKLKEKAEPAEIAAYEKTLGAAIRSARTGARPGDLLSRELQPIL